MLSFKHQISLMDSRSSFTTPGETVDRGVVMAQFADGGGSPVGDWIKLFPFQNPYDQQGTDDRGIDQDGDIGPTAELAAEIQTVAILGGNLYAGGTNGND